MKRLLIVTHCPSPNTENLRERCIQAARHAAPNIEVKSLAALQTTADDVLNADALLLGTTENLGYMSGGMKDFFDRIYYPCLEKTEGLSVAAWVRAGQDGTGTKRALKTITTGLRWRWQQAPVVLKGDWKDDFLADVEELSAAIAAGLEMGVF